MTISSCRPASSILPYKRCESYNRPSNLAKKTLTALWIFRFFRPIRFHIRPMKFSSKRLTSCPIQIVFGCISACPSTPPPRNRGFPLAFTVWTDQDHIGVVTKVQLQSCGFKSCGFKVVVKEFVVTSREQERAVRTVPSIEGIAGGSPVGLSSTGRA